MKKEYYDALGHDDFESAKIALLDLEAGLRKKNMAAANSLLEAMDEILTLHRIGVDPVLSKSLRSTNCIENLNSQLVKYTWKVKNWSSSEQRYRQTAQ